MAIYLDLNSEYRNRNSYPSPFEYVITRDTQTDLVFEEAPEHEWHMMFELGGTTPGDECQFTVIENWLPNGGSNVGHTKLYITQSIGTMNKRADYYVGALIKMYSYVHVSYRIVEYTPIADRDALVTINAPINSLLNFNTVGLTFTGVIISPTDFSLARVFVPFSPSITDYYVGKYLYDVENNDYRTITAFDPVMHVTTLDSECTAWGSTDHFSIRSRLPYSAGTYLAQASNQYIQLAQADSNVDQFYQYKYFRYADIDVAPYYEEILITDYRAADGTFAAHGGVGTNTFTLDSNASSTDDYYTNFIITNVTTGDDFQVSSYTGSTRSGTISGNWTGGAAGNTYIFRTVRLQSPIVASLGSTGLYEIEYQSYNNCTPLAVNTNNNEKYYNCQLLSLTLPNTERYNQGGLPHNYPYVLVQINNEPSLSTGTIISTHTQAYTFKAVITNVPTTEKANFVKLDGTDTSQLIKLNLNLPIKVKIMYPNGDLIGLEYADTVTPKAPHPLRQTSVMLRLDQV